MLATTLMVLFLLCTLLFGFVLLIRMSLLVVTVHGESMAPTLQHGDRILMLRRFLAGRLRKGQIVLLIQPGSDSREHATSDELVATPLVKRVVALAHESFEASVNHDIVAMGRWEQDPEPMVPQQQRWQIPENHVFVCGDNYEASFDSRSFGPLPVQQIQGIMLKRLTPAADVASLQPLVPFELLHPSMPIYAEYDETQARRK
ncbi:MAG TPA: signal peptidase I [Ktedonosporobacter sp.]|nr:signal peptidase I [Ktedonosporobacter sp.]